MIYNKSIKPWAKTPSFMMLTYSLPWNSYHLAYECVLSSQLDYNFKKTSFFLPSESTLCSILLSISIKIQDLLNIRLKKFLWVL